MHLPHRQPWVPHSSVQVLTANYPNSCFLSTLMPSHKRDLQSQWGAAWLASLNKVCLTSNEIFFFLSSNKGSWPYRLVIQKFINIDPDLTLQRSQENVWWLLFPPPTPSTHVRKYLIPHTHIRVVGKEIFIFFFPCCRRRCFASSISLLQGERGIKVLWALELSCSCMDPAKTGHKN